MFYDHKQSNGKNSHWRYYMFALWRSATPGFLFRMRLKKTLSDLEDRPDREYILDRVNYYNKLRVYTALPPGTAPLSRFRRKGNRSLYFFDTFEYVRWFPRKLLFRYAFGDLTTVPEYPSIVKSRPVAGDNANSVLLNLVKLRHFTFLDDKKSFREKMDKAVFRGHITNKPHRMAFVERYFGHPACDVGVISPRADFPKEWSENKRLTLWQHLDYKFVIALEGVDVASNLKWIMSSNSVAVMPRPKYETWFMEGRLLPGVHYIEISEDYSDLPERMEHYIAHPEEAEEIIRNAHEYVEQFLRPEREKLISLLVLDKYFRFTGE